MDGVLFVERDLRRVETNNFVPNKYFVARLPECCGHGLSILSKLKNPYNTISPSCEPLDDRVPASHPSP